MTHFLKTKLVAWLIAALALLGVGAQAPVKPVAPPVHVATVLDAVNAGIISTKDLSHAQKAGAFGATGIVPLTAAFFETYITAGISASDSSFTLASNLTTTGAALSNGYWSFVLDQGTPTQEVVECTLTGTTAAGCVRGVDPQNPNATSSVVAFQHSRAADVKVTDYTFITHVQRILNGNDTLPGIINYPSSVTNAQIGASGQNLANVSYVNSTTIAGAPAMDTATAGIGILSTIGKLILGNATTSYLGSVYNLVPWNKYFNNTPSATTTVPVTDTDGTLPTGFIKQSGSYTWTGSTTFSNALTFTGTSTFAGNSIFSKLSSFGVLLGGGASATTTSVAPGTSGNVLTSNGSTWTSATASPHNIVAVTSTAVTVASTNVETPLYATTSIPANTLGTNGVLHILMRVTNISEAAAATLNVKVKYGGSTILNDTVSPSTGSQFGNFEFYIFADGATNAQRVTASYFVCTGGATFGASGSGSCYISGDNQTAAVDSTSAQNLSITGTWSASSASNTITVQTVLVEKIQT